MTRDEKRPGVDGGADALDRRRSDWEALIFPSLVERPFSDLAETSAGGAVLDRRQ
jgi:hypothetical protein